MSSFDRKQSDQADDDRIELVDMDSGDGKTELPRNDSDTSQPEDLFPSLPSFMRRRRVQLAATTVIILVALAVLLGLNGSLSGLLATVRPATVAHSLPTRFVPVYTPVAIQSQDGIACLVTSLWSPDSRQIAVLGYDQDCPQALARSMPGRLNIYDAASKKLIRQLRLDTLLTPLITKRLGQQGDSSIQYDNALWSSRGDEVVLSFSLITSSESTIAGLLFLTENGRVSRLLLGNPLFASSNAPSYREWDLERGVQTVVYVNSPSQYSNTNIPTAAAYTWGKNGALEPVSVPADKLGPVGNPLADATFTIWQPGFTGLAGTFPGTPTPQGSFPVWSTQFAAWSPDGRYLIEQIYAGGRFIMPRQPTLSQQELAALNIQSLGLLSVRDKALAQIVAALLTSGNPSLAWRPDGRVLAADYSGQIVIYDCATGKKLASLLPPGKPINLNGGGEILAWAPDGSHLLLSSAVWGLLSVWGPGQLP